MCWNDILIELDMLFFSLRAIVAAFGNHPEDCHRGQDIPGITQGIFLSFFFDFIIMIYVYFPHIIYFSYITQSFLQKVPLYYTYLTNIPQYISLCIYPCQFFNMQIMKPFKLALLQTKCVTNKQQNWSYIKQALLTAGNNGASVSILGQICNSPYTRQYMIKFAQEFKDKDNEISPTLKIIQDVCKEKKMYTIGTIPRKQVSGENVKYFNTAFVIDKDGKLLTRMDKIHLFDIDIPGKITYKESDTFEFGKNICVFDTEFCKFGIGICYDLRFAELGLIMAQKGARVLIYPGSFNQVTGPLHWQLLLRGRALDTQCYTVGVSCAQNKDQPNLYQAWGHSTAVDPFGKVLVSLDQNPAIAYCEINPQYTEEVRTNIPLRNQRRKDLYKLEEVQ